MNMTILMMMILSTTFMLMNHPISFGSVLIVQTIMMAVTSGLSNTNFWFSYILFLVMIGGMLIMFIYMTSIASNEKFKFSLKMTLILPITFAIKMIAESNIFEDNLKINETIIFNTPKMITFLNKYFNFPFSMMATFLMIYLLLTLIVVVKLTKKKLGPLRQKL
uniref:NADH-ubiquinone oxidoreductase chain 6 n=1 Tax=Chrysodinopsis sp. EMHAU-1507081 TaxID=2480059 RepID=A0A3G3C789_9CUCU|nr:NADH dehydrogenase subunit 6 [Chrysodinopsis sp. EMHAU-1507081]